MRNIITTAQEACGVGSRSLFRTDDQVKASLRGSIAKWDIQIINDILEMPFSSVDDQKEVIIKQMCVMELIRRTIDKDLDSKMKDNALVADNKLLEQIAEKITIPTPQYDNHNRDLKLGFVLERIRDAIYQDHTDQNLRNNKGLVEALQGCCIQIFAKHRNNVMGNQEVNGVYVDEIYQGLRHLELEGRKAPTINTLKEAKKYARDMRKEGKDVKEIAHGIIDNASLFCIKQLSDKLQDPTLLEDFGKQHMAFNILDAISGFLSKLFQRDDQKEAEKQKEKGANKSWVDSIRETFSKSDINR